MTNLVGNTTHATITLQLMDVVYQVLEETRDEFKAHGAELVFKVDSTHEEFFAVELHYFFSDYVSEPKKRGWFSDADLDIVKAELLKVADKLLKEIEGKKTARRMVVPFIWEKGSMCDNAENIIRNQDINIDYCYINQKLNTKASNGKCYPVEFRSTGRKAGSFDIWEVTMWY